MLKREIKYTDFNDEKVTDVFYFNISKTELIELEVEYEGGMQRMIEKIIESKDNKAIIEQFKKLILLAYGEKSEDGKRFIKSDKLREEFSQTAAYQELFMEIALDAKAGADFVIGVMPKDMAAEMEKSLATTTPTPPAA